MLVNIGGVHSFSTPLEPDLGTARILGGMPNPRSRQAELIRGTRSELGVLVAAGAVARGEAIAVWSDQFADSSVLVALDGWLVLPETLGHLSEPGQPNNPLVGLARHYQQDGIGWLASLEGDFAICVIDEHGQRVVLVRSALSSRPIHWRRVGTGRVAIGTVATALRLASETSNLSLDGPTIWREMLGMPTVAPQTFFSNVFAVPMGSVVVIGERTESLTRTFAANRSCLRDLSDEEIVTHYQRGITKSIEGIAERTSGQVGVALSGGLDSSVVAGALSQNERLSRRGLCFTGRLRDAEADLRRAYDVATHCKLSHVVCDADDSIASDDVVLAASNPFLAARVGFAAELFEFCRMQGVEVVLTGAIGDIIGGNSWSASESLLEDPVRSLREALAQPSAHQKFLAVAGMGVLLGREVAARLGETRLYAMLHVRVRRELAMQLGLVRAPRNSVAALESEFWSYMSAISGSGRTWPDLSAWLLDHAVENELVGWDTASRAVGVELVHPLATRELYEAAMALPNRLRRVGRLTRVALRRAALPWLPHSVLANPKKISLTPHFRPQWEQYLAHPNTDLFGSAGTFCNTELLRNYAANPGQLPARVLRTTYQCSTFCRWQRLNSFAGSGI